MAWPHLAQHPEVGGEGEIGHRGVEAAAPGRVALPHLIIYVSTSKLILAPSSQFRLSVCPPIVTSQLFSII